jgi:glycerate 2-kinase
MNAVARLAQMQSGISPERAVLLELFHTALRAVDPLQVVPLHLPPPPKGRTIVIGAGKASARMALALEKHWQGQVENLQGLVVTRYGHGEACKHIEIVEAGHPVPDDAGVKAAQRIMQMVQGLTADDMVVALISGGGSSLLSAPAAGLTLSDKREVTTALLHSGATITEMNCVRKHLSAIKGGKLAAVCGAATVWTLVVSDVPGDDPRVVASGPTLPDDTTPADAYAVLRRYRIQPSAVVAAVLDPKTVTSHMNKQGERVCKVVATAQQALDAAAKHAQSIGLTPIVLGNAIEGEARHVGMVQAGIARQIAQHAQPAKAPVVLLSGGETTVTVQGKGRGGRNAEYLLSHAIAMQDLPNVWGIAADTDGIDGSETNAGAVFEPGGVDRALTMGLNARDYLASNDAFSYFETLGDLIVTGPTRTNVNDFRATLIL